jgi:peroxiredoxin
VNVWGGKPKKLRERILRKWQSLAVAVVAAGVSLFISCGGIDEIAAGKPKLKAEHERNEAADFALEDANGQTLKLSDLRGKVVLLNFWATWCTPCKVEIPWFVEMEREFKDEGFAVVGVSMDEDGWDAVKPFMSDLKINYRMVLGTEEMAQLYGGIEALPTSYILDRDGKVASVHMGIVSRSVFEEEIRALLAKKVVADAAATMGNRNRSLLPSGTLALRAE